MKSLLNMYHRFVARVTGDTFVSTTNNPDYYQAIDRDNYSVWKQGEVFHSRMPNADGKLAVLVKDYNPFKERLIRVARINTKDEFVNGVDYDEHTPTHFNAHFRRDSNGEVWEMKCNHTKTPQLKQY